MYIEKTKPVKKIVNEVIERYYECDDCKQKIVVGSYDQFKCYFKHEAGKVYPEGGKVEQRKFHFCQKCGEKMMALISATINSKPNYMEIDL